MTPPVTSEVTSISISLTNNLSDTIPLVLYELKDTETDEVVWMEDDMAMISPADVFTNTFHSPDGRLPITLTSGKRYSFVATTQVGMDVISSSVTNIDYVGQESLIFSGVFSS